MKYAANVKLSVKEIRNINSLLSIDDFETYHGTLHIEEDSQKKIYSAKFDNGDVISCYLCSGQSNYWLDYGYVKAGTNTETFLDDVGFHLDENADEVYTDNNNYIIDFKS